MNANDTSTVPQNTEPLPTIWEVTDAMWEVTDAMWEGFFLPIINHLDPAFTRGRPRTDLRRCLDGMTYRARTGCQWNQLPEKFGSDSTVHRTIQRWDSKGVFDAVWALLIYHCEELKAVHWEWQAVDGTLNKARFIGNGPKGGVKRASQKLGVPKPKSEIPKQKMNSPKSRRTATPKKVLAPTPRIVPK